MNTDRIMRMEKRLAIIFCLLWPAFCMAQNTAPTSISYSHGTYQVSGLNVMGQALDWAGWMPGKRAEFQRPVEIAARVDSIGGSQARFRYIMRYAGLTDTLFYLGPRYAAFYLPDSGQATTGIPDSLFYVVPDSSGMAVGDEFQLSSLPVRAGDQYAYRLLFSNDTLKGGETLQSQPLWIGYGVAAIAFGYQAKTDTARGVYRTAYSNAYAGPYLYFMSSDTLADSTWTKTALAGAWNYRAPTASAIDKMRWMVVDRIGKAAADTIVINGESVYLRSQ